MLGSKDASQLMGSANTAKTGTLREAALLTHCSSPSNSPIDLQTEENT